MIRVTVWNEFRQERLEPLAGEVYPEGIHTAVARGVKAEAGDDATITTATLDSPDNGLPASVLDHTDVLMWWAHKDHDEVPDDVVGRITDRVLGGMGLIALHSAQASKVFQRLMGTTCSLQWRNSGDRELIWSVRPEHPICAGVAFPVVIPAQETFGEPFDIPAPDELVFVSSFAGGEVFRSGCCFERGRGRIFYFSPGHEEYPVYYLESIRRILWNAIRWASPAIGVGEPAENKFAEPR